MPFWHGLGLRAGLIRALRSTFGFGFKDLEGSKVRRGMGGAVNGRVGPFGRRRFGDGGRFVLQRSFSEAGTGFARGDELAGKFDDAGGQQAGGLDDGFFEGIEEGLGGWGSVVKSLSASLGGSGARRGQRIGADRIADEVRLIRGRFGFGGGSFGDGSTARCGRWFGRAGRFGFSEEFGFVQDRDGSCGWFGSGRDLGRGPGWIRGGRGGGAGSGFGGHGIAPAGHAGVAFGHARGHGRGSGFQAGERGLIFRNARAAAAMGAQAGTDLVLPHWGGSGCGRGRGGQIGRRSAQNIILFGRIAQAKLSRRNRVSG